MELNKFSEIIGRLQSVEQTGDYQILIFTFEDQIVIPNTALNTDLTKHIGERIGVFNGGDIGYQFRIIKS